MSQKLLEDARLKAAVDIGTRQRSIEFYALAFSKTPDKQGDVISPGAADDWLARFYAAGRPLPVSFTHAAVRQPEDPFNIVGFAPADSQHVFKDEHGIRVVALLDTDSNPTAAQVYSLARRGIITGASVAYFTGVDDQHLQDDGSTLITKIQDVLECGPCLDPANDDAYMIAVKSMEAKLKASVDTSTWDGGRAMGACSSASDYRSICAGEKSVGDPDERQHWALPHHYLGRGPNAAGVRNALARLPQTEGLKNAGGARSHLEAHMAQVNPDREASNGNAPRISSNATELHFGIAEAVDLLVKTGRVLSAHNRDSLQEAYDVIGSLLALSDASAALSKAKVTEANGEEPEQANPEEPPPGPNDDIRRQLEELAAPIELARQLTP